MPRNCTTQSGCRDRTLTRRPWTAGVIGLDPTPAADAPVACRPAGGEPCVGGAMVAPMTRRRRIAMECFAGLDVSIEETVVCVVDAKGIVLFTGAAPTEPEAIAAALEPFAPSLRRVGHEAGALSPWLHPELKALGLPAVCLEARHVRAAMSAQRNKTDATDALGLAHICAGESVTVPPGSLIRGQMKPP
jgi:Transposase